MSEDEDYIGSKVPGRIYGSKSFPLRTEEKRARYLDRIFPEIEAEFFAKIKDERVLRTTDSGRRQIKIFVVEDPRGIRQLILQNFSLNDDQESYSKNTHFQLYGEEIHDLLEICTLASNAEFTNSEKFKIGKNQLHRLDISKDAAASIISKHLGLIGEVLKNEVTERDIVSVAYRKKQLRVFENLLRDDSFFKEKKRQAPNESEEAVWQEFFEKNHWIFGGSLFFSSTSSIDGGKLERFVSGASIAGPGKESDAVLRSKGKIGALCFVEIKSHNTELQKHRPYRSGVWPPSDDLVSAISQSQRTVQLAESNIKNSLQPSDRLGNPISERVYLYRPRSVLICGNLNQFLTENGVNEEKYASFELFRRSINAPEIMTYDELFERAKLMIDS